MPHHFRRAGVLPRLGLPLHGEPTTGDHATTSIPGRPWQAGGTAVPTWEELLGQR